MSRGSAEPLCARIKGANRWVSEGKYDLQPRSVFSKIYERQQEGGNEDSMGVFQGCTAMDIGTNTTIFLISACRVALKNSGLLIKTDWSVNCLLCC